MYTLETFEFVRFEMPDTFPVLKQFITSEASLYLPTKETASSPQVKTFADLLPYFQTRLQKSSRTVVFNKAFEKSSPLLMTNSASKHWFLLLSKKFKNYN